MENIDFTAKKKWKLGDGDCIKAYNFILAQ